MDQHLEEMLKMDEESRIAYLKAFTRLACADGSFDENEKRFIKNLAKTYHVSEDGTAEIFSCAEDDAIIEDLKKIKSRRVALELIKELCILAHADDVLTDEETLFIGRVGQAMGVELDKIEQISNWVIDKIILAEEAEKERLRKIEREFKRQAVIKNVVDKVKADDYSRFMPKAENREA